MLFLYVLLISANFAISFTREKLSHAIIDDGFISWSSIFCPLSAMFMSTSVISLINLVSYFLCLVFLFSVVFIVVKGSI